MTLYYTVQYYRVGSSRRRERSFSDIVEFNAFTKSLDIDPECSEYATGFHLSVL